MKTKLVLAGLLAGAMMLGTACKSDDAAMREDTDVTTGPGTGGAGQVQAEEEDPIDPGAGRLQGQGIGAPESDIMRERVRGETQFQQDDTSTLDDEQADDEDRQVKPEE